MTFTLAWWVKRDSQCLNKELEGSLSLPSVFAKRLRRTGSALKLSCLLAAPGEAQRAKPGAGEGNRTLTTSLEGWSSTIELHPLIPKQLPYKTEGATYSGGFFELQPII